MASNRNTFLLLLISISVKSVISDGLVPVFVWGDVANAKLNTNALSTLNQMQFIEVLQKEVQDEVVIVFEEETLSVEDFSRRDSSGGTPYPYFQSMISESVYLPSVDSPLKTLNLVADNDQHLKLTDKGLSGKLDLNPGTYIFVSLKDARPDESRFQMLRRHNDFIQQTIADAKKKNNRVVGIYTAHFPSWTNEEYHTRVRRAVTPRNYITYNTPNVLLYVKNVTFYAPNISEPLVDGIITSNKTDPGRIVATIEFPNEVALKMFFLIEGGYWVLPTVEIKHPRHVVSENNTMLLYNSDVYALQNFSFRCGPLIKFKSPVTPQQVTRQYSIGFEDMQLQVYDTEKLNDTFGDPFNCVGFTSVPIWAGLMIVFIMIAITMYGFMMMMDIRTMDRFDDPKGKTIAINAAE